MNWLIEMFSYPFMVRATIVGVLLSVVAALVGVSLVPRKNSMIGDGLSHAAFGAFAVAISLGFVPIWFALPIVIIASFIVLRLNQNKSINGDAAIALLSASSLAIGTMAISISKGVNIDLNGYLFGSILSVGWSDVYLSAGLCAAVIALYLFTHNTIFAITFDEEFAEAIGARTKLYDGIFAAICSIVVVLGMRLLGALLISSLIIFPTLIATRFAKSFQKAVIIAVAVSVAGFLIGITLSYLLATPTGATVVIVNLLGLCLAEIAKRLSQPS